MKLRALELEQFRKFERRVRLSGFGDRVNVLCGPNEFGKSTMLVAVRALLFERHNSKADPIRRMQSWRGNAAPMLAMEFETGGGLWRIEKRFLHQPTARLTAPDGGRFDGDAAEEELQRLLGFGAAGKQGAKPDQMGVWGALWVTQRDSVLQPDFSSELARATVTSCLDAEVGAMTGSEKGRNLLRAVTEQRAKLLDGRGKPSGRHKDVVGFLAATQTRLAELGDRARRLSEDATELRRHTELLARESDPAAEQRDRDALAEARRRREAALMQAQLLDAATKARDLAARDLRDAESEQEARAARASALAARESAFAAEHATGVGAQAEMAWTEAAFAVCRTAADRAQAAATQAAAAARRQRGVAEIVRRAALLAMQQETLAQAGTAQDRVSELTARLAAIRVDAASIEALRKAQRELESAQAVLDAQATQIAFDLLPDVGRRVTVAGAPLDEGAAPIAVVDDTEIVIEGIGRLRVRPAIRDRDKLTKRLAAAENSLRGALIAADCETPTQAEVHLAERQGLQRALDDARATLQRLVPGDAKTGLSAGIGALREQVDVLGRRLQEERAAMLMEALPTPAQASALAAIADEAELVAVEALNQARAELDGAADRRTAARDAQTAAGARARDTARERDRLLSESQAAEAREPTQALAARRDNASLDAERRSAALAKLQHDRAQDTVGGMQARIERYEQALAGRQQNVRGLREAIAELRARIAQEGGHGLDEQIAAAERERDALVLEQAGHVRDARVLSLLLETLTAAEKETKERYLAPVVRRVTPYLRSLFPGADISCDDALRITGLTREHLGHEAFDRLSDGTQEQIAVLSRLAFAEMLKDSGKPAMVILDDALAYSDAERMERMFDVLTQAAQRTQILVLTCREDLFTRLGGNRIELKHAEIVVS